MEKEMKEEIEFLMQHYESNFLEYDALSIKLQNKNYKTTLKFLLQFSVLKKKL
jgi:hypothetical protein